MREYEQRNDRTRLFKISNQRERIVLRKEKLQDIRDRRIKEREDMSSDEQRKF